MSGNRSNARSAEQRRPYVPAVGPGLRRLLRVVFALFAALAANAAYLGGVTLLEWATGRSHQDPLYQLMFLAHLVLGLAIVVPVIAFGVAHGARARRRPNRRAVRAGAALFATALALLASGLLLTRFGFAAVESPGVRSAAYWIHVVTPFAAAWLFVLHRLAGPRLRWRVGAAWAAASALFCVALAAPAFLPSGGAAPAAADPFAPSLARTASGERIPAEALMRDAYCEACHADVHERWAHSAHRFASFDNPAYRFSVEETRARVLARDGDVRAARFCAGCHDPVPLFSGRFDDPAFDASDPTASAGITCSVCHAITSIDSTRGNADYTIAEPVHYPFAESDNAFLLWVNHQLVKAKPAFHRQTFLKPVHREAEFCGSCHKAHLPQELNAYKWLRGQNHYDSYLASGVSGHGVASFYYPSQAVDTCGECHMPLRASKELGARDFDGSGERSVHDHLFAAGNTALPQLLGLPAWVGEAHRELLEGSVRVDLFGLRAGGTIEGALTAPLGPEVPTLEPGRSYLLEVVVRTLELGHHFTQGTADSNQVWLALRVTSAGRVLGESGALAADGTVDPWSHFVNAYVLDRDGRRIDRRNVQDIFVPLYDHQIPPGAADVVHYRIDVPEDVAGPIEVEAALRYRKFDTTFLRHFSGQPDAANELPIVTLASARLRFPVAAGRAPAAPPDPVPAWERWNDYGIGLLRKGRRGSRKGELRQAEAAFARVEALGAPAGPLNLARVYLKEGRLADAASALRRAAAHTPPAPPWSVAWFSALVDLQNGELDAAIEGLRALTDTRFAGARERGFDFALDARLWNRLGQALFERAKQERGAARAAAREAFLAEAAAAFERALAIDAEDVPAHYNLSLVYAQLGRPERAARHRSLHATYKPDDNARDRAVALHRRRHAAADRAAEAIVIYELRLPARSDERLSTR